MIHPVRHTNLVAALQRALYRRVILAGQYGEQRIHHHQLRQPLLIAPLRTYTSFDDVYSSSLHPALSGDLL